jgi:hypothetical protein
LYGAHELLIVNPRIFLHCFLVNRRGKENIFLSDIRIHFLGVVLDFDLDVVFILDFVVFVFILQQDLYWMDLDFGLDLDLVFCFVLPYLKYKWIKILKKNK